MSVIKKGVLLILALVLLALTVSCKPVEFDFNDDSALRPNKLYSMSISVLYINENEIAGYGRSNGRPGDLVYVYYPGAAKEFRDSVIYTGSVRIEFYGRNYKAEEKIINSGGSKGDLVCKHVISKVKSICLSNDGAVYDKPIIYLYPEADTVCSVALEFDGELTCTYPEYGADGWQNIVARPDGTLVFPDGSEYYALYWEGAGNYDWFDLSSGFCVKGADTARFLAETLPQLGLSAREANEFIIYWLPILQANPYNLISFQTSTYADNVKLLVSPEPDSVVRILMAYMPLEHAVNIPPQQLIAPERTGFTVVEWGGTEVKR